MTIEAAGPGELLATTDDRPFAEPRGGRTFTLRMPVRISGSTPSDATLTVRLMHPEAETRDGLQHRSYRFDESTRRHSKADGETITLDDVFAALRTEAEQLPVSVRQVSFGALDGATIAVRVEGLTGASDAAEPFRIDAVLRAG